MARVVTGQLGVDAPVSAGTPRRPTVPGRARLPGLPRGWRQEPATLLLNGVPVHVVAARLGHADPAIKLPVYAHIIRAAGNRRCRRILLGYARYCIIHDITHKNLCELHTSHYVTESSPAAPECLYKRVRSATNQSNNQSPGNPLGICCFCRQEQLSILHTSYRWDTTGGSTRTMNQTFWVSIGAACITATGAITGALLAAGKNGSAQRKLDEIKRREDSYYRFIEQVRAGADPGTVLLGSTGIPEIIAKFREDCHQTGYSEEKLIPLVRALEADIAKDRASSKKRIRTTDRFIRVSFVLLVSTIALFAAAAVAVAAAIAIVAIIPNSTPAKLIRDIFSHSTTRPFIPSSPETPAVTPSGIPTPSSISTPTQGTSPNATAIAGQTATSQKPKTTPSPTTSNAQTAESRALLAPSCGSGSAVTCVSQVVSGVASTCAAASAQSTPSANLPSDISGVVGGATKCVAGAVTAVVPVTTPSPSATASASSLSLP